MKWFVIVLGALLVLACAGVGVVGAGRAPGDPTRPGGLAEAIGGLLPAVEVSADDVAGSGCWDRTGTMTVPAGATCPTRLPPRATRLRLCVEAGTVAGLTVKGSDYGAQRPPLAKASCGGDGLRLDLYDQGSLLTVVCAPLSPAPCRLRIVT